MVQPSKGVKINWTLKTEPGSQDKNNVKINQFHGKLDLADFAHTERITVSIITSLPRHTLLEIKI